MSYQSTLLSTLIPIRYAATVETLADAAASKLPMLIIRGVSVNRLFAVDQRPAAKEIAPRIETFKRRGKYPKDVLDRYASSRSYPAWFISHNTHS